ncbi:MAG: alpha/beta hydrolase, partial [Ruminococcus sp.]|nr:alpha/beta hydrolase [Ruminococcus sp.]
SRAAVFGASLGGMIAQTLAINRPDLVSALVLGSTTSRCNPTIRSVALEWASDAEKGDIASLVKKYTQNLYTERTAKLFGEMLLQLNSDLSGEELKRFAAQARAITSFDVYEKLDKIKAPTLVIGVEGDKVVSGEASTEIAEKIGCELYMYGREYAHCVFDEAPDYKNRLLSFFEKTKTIEKN